MKTRADGFTLLEVMAAIMIMALAFAFLLQAMGASVALTHKAAARTQAAAWAQSLLDSAYVMTPPQAGVRQGRFDKTYHWRLTVQRWQPRHAIDKKQAVRNNDLRLYQLDLAVMWGAPPRQQVAHFATLRVANPGSSATGSP